MSTRTSTPAKSEGADKRVRRYLIVANQTLVSPALEQLVHEYVAAYPCEFHVLVPKAPTPTIHVDPSGLIDVTMQRTTSQHYAMARHEAEERLASFRATFAEYGVDLTGEVAGSDPLAAARRVLERQHFDEIIVSTLPPGISRWLRLDLPNRFRRAFDLPTTCLIQEDELVTV